MRISDWSSDVCSSDLQVSGRIVDFIEDLFGHRMAVDQTAGLARLADHEAAVGDHLDDGKTDGMRVGHIFDAGRGVIAAGGLGAEFEQVAGQGTAGDAGKVAERTAEVTDEGR